MSKNRSARNTQPSEYVPSKIDNLSHQTRLFHRLTPLTCSSSWCNSVIFNSNPHLSLFISSMTCFPRLKIIPTLLDPSPRCKRSWSSFITAFNPFSRMGIHWRFSWTESSLSPHLGFYGLYLFLHRVQLPILLIDSIKSRFGRFLAHPRFVFDLIPPNTLKNTP